MVKGENVSVTKARANSEIMQEILLIDDEKAFSKVWKAMEKSKEQTELVKMALRTLPFPRKCLTTVLYEDPQRLLEQIEGEIKSSFFVLNRDMEGLVYWIQESFETRQTQKLMKTLLGEAYNILSSRTSSEIKQRLGNLLTLVCQDDTLWEHARSHHYIRPEIMLVVETWNPGQTRIMERIGATLERSLSSAINKAYIAEELWGGDTLKTVMEALDRWDRTVKTCPALGQAWEGLGKKDKHNHELAEQWGQVWLGQDEWSQTALMAWCRAPDPDNSPFTRQMMGDRFDDPLYSDHQKIAQVVRTCLGMMNNVDKPASVLRVISTHLRAAETPVDLKSVGWVEQLCVVAPDPLSIALLYDRSWVWRMAQGETPSQHEAVGLRLNDPRLTEKHLSRMSTARINLMLNTSKVWQDWRDSHGRTLLHAWCRAMKTRDIITPDFSPSWSLLRKIEKRIPEQLTETDNYGVCLLDNPELLGEKRRSQLLRKTLSKQHVASENAPAKSSKPKM